MTAKIIPFDTILRAKFVKKLNRLKAQFLLGPIDCMVLEVAHELQILAIYVRAHSWVARPTNFVDVDPDLVRSEDMKLGELARKEYQNLISQYIKPPSGSQ